MFEGRKVSGNVKLKIDGALKEYQTVFVEEAGTLCPFDIDGSELILKLLDNTPMALIQDGVYLETGLPVEAEVVEGYRAALQAPYKALPAKNKAAMASFLTFVILTYLNIILIIIGTPLKLPFQRHRTADTCGVGVVFSGRNAARSGGHPVAGRILLIASVFLVLYLLGRKKNWPVLTALILIGIDTVILLFIAIADFTGFIIDIAFHVWVLVSMIKLYATPLKNQKKQPEPPDTVGKVTSVLETFVF